MGTWNSAIEEDPGLAERTVRKVRRRILPFIATLYVINYLDRVNVGYAKLGMEKELAISAASYGLAAAIFFIAYFFFEVPSNMIMKVVGARKWMARIAVSWGIVVVLTGFINSVPMLYVARIMLGIAEAGFFPGMLLYLTFWFRAQDRARAVAAFTLAQPIAFILGASTGGLILQYVHWAGLSNWRWIFILQGAPAIILGVVTYFYLPDYPHTARWLSRAESTWLEGSIAGEQKTRGDESPRAQLRALKNPRVLHLAAIYLSISVGFYGFNFFLPTVVKQINPHYSSTNLGFYAAVPYVIGGIAMLVNARHSDKTGERKYHVISVLALSAAALVGVMAFLGRPTLALICLCLVAIGLFGYLAPFWALASWGMPKEHVAVGIAVVNSVGNLGGFVGPYLVGESASDTNVTSSLVIPIIAFIASVILLMAWKTRDTDGLPIAQDGLRKAEAG